VHTDAIGRYSSPDNTEEESMQDLSREYVDNLITTHAGSAQAIEILNLKIFQGMSHTEIAGELGIRSNQVARTVSEFRNKLRELSQNEDPNIPCRPKQDSAKRTFWDDLFEHVEEYRRRFENHQGMLKPFHKLMVQKFFEFQTGDRDTTLEVVWRWFQDNGWNITKDTARRAINAGINQINNREPSGRANEQMSSGWARHQQTHLVQEIFKDPNTWDTFSQQRRYILKRFFIDGAAGTITQRQIAQELGLNESIVSREIDRALREIYRVKGNPIYNDQLLSKSRNLLPK